VLDRLAQLSNEAVGVTRQLYNVGAADRPDVLEAEIEAQRAQLDLTAARNNRFAVWRRLAATVGDPTLLPRPLATSIDAAIPELDRETALKQIVDQSPEFRAARADIERNRAIVSRARRETFPDLFLRGGLAYNRELLETSTAGRPVPVGREGSFEVGLSVPLVNRNQGGVAAARAEQSRAEVEMMRLQLSIEARLASAFDAYLTALRATEAYRNDMLPRAEEAYSLYLARYREAAAAYPQVLIAQRTLFQLNAEYLEDLEAAWRSALRIQGFLVDDDGLAAPMRPGEMP
jgi:cobalt-zinc-cadmium efflux system outer membrane protein